MVIRRLCTQNGGRGDTPKTDPSTHKKNPAEAGFSLTAFGLGLDLPVRRKGGCAWGLDLGSRGEGSIVKWLRLQGVAVPTRGLSMMGRGVGGRIRGCASRRARSASGHCRRPALRTVKPSGQAPAGALPPVAADGSAGDEGDVAPVDGLVDVGVALEDGDDVVAVEEGKDLPGRCRRRGRAWELWASLSVGGAY